MPKGSSKRLFCIGFKLVGSCRRNNTDSSGRSFGGVDPEHVEGLSAVGNHAFTYRCDAEAVGELSVPFPCFLAVCRHVCQRDEAAACLVDEALEGFLAVCRHLEEGGGHWLEMNVIAVEGALLSDSLSVRGCVYFEALLARLFR